jgi:hypothetical protein
VDTVQLGMQNAAKQRGGRERSSKLEYLIVNVRMERMKGHPYIGQGMHAEEVPRSRSGTRIRCASSNLDVCG